MLRSVFLLMESFLCSSKPSLESITTIVTSTHELFPNRVIEVKEKQINDIGGMLSSDFVGILGCLYKGGYKPLSEGCDALPVASSTLPRPDPLSSAFLSLEDATYPRQSHADEASP